MSLTQAELYKISAGIAAKSVVEAITIGMQVYETSALVIDASQSSLYKSTQIYANLGHQLGEHLFNVAYPNPLGQMVYTQSDFK